MANDDSTISEEISDEIAATAEVSAAYQALEQESPPAELNDKILQAARAGLEKPQSEKNAFDYRRYSIAASVCVFVLVGSMFVNNELPPPGANRTIESSNTEINFNFDSSSSPSPANAALEDESTDALRADLNANASEASLGIATLAPQPQAALAQEPELDAAVLDSDQATGQVFQESLEEIAITGARITRAAAQSAVSAEQDTPAYRSSVELWLQEIRSLLSSNEEAAENEITLFSQAYPEIDIEAALGELEQ